MRGPRRGFCCRQLHARQKSFAPLPNYAEYLIGGVACRRIGRLRPYFAGSIVLGVAYGRAAAALTPAVIDRYPVVPAFLMASSASAVVISGVVFSLFTEPPAAIAIAAALTLSGISVMTTTSYSPKAKNALWMRPPSFSIGPRTASMRSWGLATRRAQASGV